MDQQFKLNTSKILEKQFHVDFKGYSAHEVDAFLDQVINDYERFDQIVETLGKKINQLELTNASLKAQVMDLESEQALAAISSDDPISQVDIVKRLAKLEKEVYSKQL